MKTIMIVDDEGNILEEIKKNLEEGEFQVITAKNNRKALELINNDKEDKISHILIDTNLPDSDKPALFLLTTRSKRNIDTCKKDNFLEKPFTKTQLIDFLKNKI